MIAARRPIATLALVIVTMSGCQDDAAKFLFTTSMVYTGDLGGLAGADAKCALSANAAGLGGTFIALLSDSSTNAVDRVGNVGPWQLTNGDVVFNDKAGLATVPLVALGVTEARESLGPGCAWTGSKVGGKVAPELCMNWTVGFNGTAGKTGNTNLTDNRWIEGVNDCGNQSCNLSHHLYCIEQ